MPTCLPLLNRALLAALAATACACMGTGTTMDATPQATVRSAPATGTATESATTGATGTTGGITVLSWNVLHLGNGKDAIEMGTLARVIAASGADVVALQEISYSLAGQNALNRLMDILNADNAVAWDAMLSEVPNTIVPGERERYAFLYRPARVRPLGEGALSAALDAAISREPYVATFVADTDTLTLATLHALPDAKKDPRPEVRALARLPALLPNAHLVILGDFNLSERDNAWQPARMAGLVPAFNNQKTTIKGKLGPRGETLANPLDNCWYEAREVRASGASIIPFYEQFPSLEEARKVSDHVPIRVHLQVVR